MIGYIPGRVFNYSNPNSAKLTRAPVCHPCLACVFGALEEPDVKVLMRIGTQQQLHVSDQLLAEGTYHDAIYLVLDGELSVSVKGRNTAIAYVGKGDIVGEMSLLESQPASATLCARRLTLSRESLTAPPYICAPVRPLPS